MAGSSPEHRYLNWVIGGAVALLLGCGGLASCVIFTGDAKDTVRTTPSASPSPELSLEPSPSPSGTVTKDVFFKTCTDAVKAGVPLPIRSNEPGYRVALDGDEDGKACE